ncbi:MAG: DUF3626 domain-containing protein [Bilophila wadsworthia]
MGAPAPRGPGGHERREYARAHGRGHRQLRAPGTGGRARRRWPAAATSETSTQGSSGTCPPAGLTINVDLGFLFGMNGPKPLLKAGGAWEHIFHSIEAAPDEASRQAAIDVKGAGYIQKRDNVERGLFPELSEDRPAVANERPTYAALNLLRQRTGAAPTYGTVALHLKPEVARRATYTVDDTFVALRLRYTEAGRQAVLDLLPGSPGISEAHKLDLMTEGSELRRRLDAIFDGMAAKGEFRADLFKNEFQLFGLEDDENSALAGLFIKVFKDTQSTRKAMASFDSLETLLPELGDMDAVSLARAALDRQQHGMGRVASECNYIEAQVHGPIVFARDVAEIVINKEFGLDQLPQAQRHGSMPWSPCSAAAARRRGHGRFFGGAAAELAAIREQLGGAVIPVRIEEQIPELDLKNTVRSEERAFTPRTSIKPASTRSPRRAAGRRRASGFHQPDAQYTPRRSGGFPHPRHRAPRSGRGRAKRPRSLCRLCRTIPACSPERAAHGG